MFIRVTLTVAVLLAALSPVIAAPLGESDSELALRIVDLQYLESTNSSRLVIRANLPFTYKAYSEGQTTLVIETEKADISAIAPGITIGSNSIDSIKVSNRLTPAAEEVTAISIRHYPDKKYKITPKGRRLFVEFYDVADGRGIEQVAENDPMEADSEPVDTESGNELDKAETEVEEVEIAKNAGGVEKNGGGSQAEVDDAVTDAALKYRLNPVVHYNMVNLAVREKADDSAVIISFDRPIDRELYRVVPVGKPPRFVVDFHGASNLLTRKSDATGSQFFSSVRSAQFAVDPYPISRVVLDLIDGSQPAVLERGNDLVLLFGDAVEPQVEAKEELAEAVSETEEPVVEPNLAEAELTDVAKAVAGEDDPAPEVPESVVDEQAQEDEEIEVEPIELATEMETVAEIIETEPTPETEAEAQAPEIEAQEESITAEPEEDAIETQADDEEISPVAEVAEEKQLSESRSPENSVTTEAETETIPEVENLEGSNGQAPAEEAKMVNDSTAPVEEAIREEPSEINEPTVTHVETPTDNSGSTEEPISENLSLFNNQYPDNLQPSKVERPAASKPKTFSSKEPRQKEISSPQERTAGSSDFFQIKEITSAERQYYGKNVSLEFETINLRALVLLLGQMTDKNFVVDPSVQPVSVTISLRDLPWDQALDIILDYYGLGKVEEGNVIRIASRSRLATEAEERRNLIEQRALAVPLRHIAKPINYAKADALANLIRRNLSSKGEVVVDQRTNTLVIADIPSKVEEHLRLIDALDIPTKQVIVEARIVETTRDFINEFGLQYGFRGSATSEYGSSTGLVFPNQVTIAGAGANLSGAGLVPFAVNLPANSVSSSIVGSFANISGSFILDVILTAAESEKKVRVLSRPRISAQNNARAEIKSGVEVPFQVVQNNTVGIRWREATLKLEVTPHITSDSTVILDLVVDKSSLGIATAAGFTIQKRAATSTVLVKDGGVAVIGGVLEISNNLTYERTPFLSKLPLIGRLFRNRLERIQNTELLIFISPKIIN